jgi:DNA repair exonuclease SbcCD ATPase subunit
MPAGNSLADTPMPLSDSQSAVELPAQELERLRAENAELRAQVEALEDLLTAPPAPASEDAWVERQREYEAILEEKSEVIRSLHLQLQELRERAAAEPSPEADPAPVAAPASSTSADIEKLRQQLEEERQQLAEDEEALMKQMRDMEMAMSRERAELARQRNELQRLHSELKHELDIAARNASLRERLLPLQRRHQDLAARKGS